MSGSRAATGGDGGKDSPSRPRRGSIGVSAPREAKMADDAHDLSEIEQLEQRLQVTTIFAARLAAYLVSKTRLGLNRGDIKKITRGLKPAEREGLSPEEKTRSGIDGRQADRIEREFQIQLDRLTSN